MARAADALHRHGDGSRGVDLADKIDIANVDAWVFRVAHNCALDLLRRRARQQSWISDAPVEDVADPAIDPGHRLAAAANLATFMQLAPAQRASVILMDVLGYSLLEIGSVLEASIASVKASLHRGRARLRELAMEREASIPAVLDPTELRQLSIYIERFNAHDFDAIREMLAEDVRLELFNRSHAAGRSEVGRYFSRYAERTDWRLRPGVVEGRPAILAVDLEGKLSYFMLIGWAGEAIASIRDFRYARYVMDGLEITALP